jgi:hypothetical protein
VGLGFPSAAAGSYFLNLFPAGAEQAGLRTCRPSQIQAHVTPVQGEGARAPGASPVGSWEALGIADKVWSMLIHRQKAMKARAHGFPVRRLG